ncbi:glycosyltransferase family 4 protein [Pontixanthobacter aquaemixtae]|uniref:Glycosyltransferase n=1 Tax=Pontixanthobacter aquaemixtae TaxID=1958940 RepID=A0A844ZSN5_9SPHN|nr:glycosyltransferase family 1 protein [Pontixanthobacter aquaemixtae]MXO90865.1 glycosyltransferase [Pontixanthobacter aquaemixtae]
MPTVCLDCRYIKPRPSGIAGVVSALVDHLPALAPDWRFLFLRHASLRRALSDAPNVTEIELAAEVNGPAGMWFLPQLVDLRGIDLFHAPANILPRGLDMPCVTTIHDLMWLTHPNLCNAGPWGRVERFFYRHGINRALEQSDAIVTVSQSTRDSIVERSAGLAGKTRAILPGVSAGFQPQDVSQAMLQHLSIGAARYVLVVGQNAPYKNHEGALRGFARAFANEPDIDLVFVQRRSGSSGPVRRLANTLNLSGRVHFLPSLEERDLATLYSGAMALLHPSFQEGFGMPLAEAMASGLPVITSKCSAMPEVTGGAALLVDPEDSSSIAFALKRVADEPGLADKLRNDGLARAKQLDWHDFAVGNLEVYKHVLGQN